MSMCRILHDLQEHPILFFRNHNSRYQLFLSGHHAGKTDYLAVHLTVIIVSIHMKSLDNQLFRTGSG